MVPSVFVILDALPLTANGKIDKKALPVPDDATIFGEYIAPKTSTEIELARIWAELLKLERDNISATGNFFDLGGHSILVMQLLNHIKQQFAVNIAMTQLFEFSQLDALALLIDRQVEGQDQESAEQDELEIEAFDEFEAFDDEDEDMEEFEI
ncbi:MAG: phosphopantetheine-binding protein [Psychrosphaera sp.]|nr:phosphopantetheine-binding protein [Psychrosphaera sp.]